MRNVHRRRIASSLLLALLVFRGAARASAVAQPEVEKGETPPVAPPQGEPPAIETPAIAPPPPSETPKVSPSAVAPLEIERPDWAFDASGFVYVTPDDTYFQPSFSTDYRALHLEARYNYEDRQTASTWIGYNLSVGQVVNLKLTPMLAGVFGATNGVALGCRGKVTWRWLELYAEGEDVVSFGDKTSSFFYIWSTLSASPLEWLHLGLAAQRTRAYETSLDIQRGFLLGFSIEHVSLTAYLFNPDLTPPTYVFALDVTW
jgi:hypothetical protein